MSTFASFYAAVKAKLDVSTVLAAALTEGAIQADHVRLERYLCISKDGPYQHDAQLDEGPNIYMIPGSYEYLPMTMQHAKGDAVVEAEIHSRIDNESAANITTHITLVDDLCTELMQGADGTGGAASWLSAIGLRLRIATSQSEQLSMTEIRTKIKIKAQLLPVV